jgi:hypothetical protein
MIAQRQGVEVMQVSQVRNICFALIAMLCASGISLTAYGQTAFVFVNIDREWPSNDAEDGESWETAFRFLQDAIERAQQIIDNPLEPDRVEIWVAQGTYRPDQRRDICGEPSEDCPDCGDCDREASFELRNRVEIYGGFSGEGWETEREDSDWELNTTILDGDLKQNDVVDIYHPQTGELVLEFANDSYHNATVRAGRDINETALLGGFIIKSHGSSAFIATDARPRVLGCTFISATRASVHLRGESLIVFDRCTFQSPANDAIKADDSAIVYCVDE